MNATPEEAIAFLSQHFVALRIEYETKDAKGKVQPRRAAVLSGFLLELHGVTLWVTAGHSLKLIDDAIVAGKLRVRESTFLDHFNLDSKFGHGVPYRYEPGCGFYIEEKDEGLDFAMIMIDGNRRKLFSANGIVPIGRPHWENQAGLTFDFYRMLGIPEDCIRFTKRPDGTLDTEVRQALLAVDRIGPDDVGEPPWDSPAPSDAWFVGRIHPECKIQDIKGMSGGPILGFRVSDGSMLCHCVAVQSRWWPHSRTIFGTSLPLFAEWAYRQLGTVLAEPASEQEESKGVNPA